MRDLLRSVRAEGLRLRRWPALWVMLGAWLLLNVTFVYLFSYLSYRGGGGGGFGGDQSAQALLAGIMPAAAPLAVVQGTPMFGGALIFTLGALAAGSGYGWGTWKTVFTQGPGRLAAVGGSLVALAGVIVALVVATFAVDLGISWALAVAEHQVVVWPALGHTLRTLGGGALILGMWTLAGFAVGTLARSPALAIGLGVVWVLAVENLLRGAAALLDWLKPVTDVLPGSAAGSLVAASGATTVSQGGTPGVVATLAGGPATWLVLAYLIAFAIAIGTLVLRRDID